LFKKYKDERLENNQFENAYKTILEENKKKKKRQPKPTHHLVIPLPDDVQDDVGEKTDNNEQQKIISFMEKYLQETTDLQREEKNDKVYFLKDLFTELEWVLKKSRDKEINIKEFESRNEETYEKKEYSKLKAIITIILSYQKKKEKSNKQTTIFCWEQN